MFLRPTKLMTIFLIMTKKLFAKVVRVVSICCALLLFIAVLPNPIDYYNVLRIIVFIGALLVILQNINTPFWVVTFAILFVLFNPIFPIHFYMKLPWIPVDIVSGLLFLVELIINRPKKSKPRPIKKEVKRYERDRIY